MFDLERALIKAGAGEEAAHIISVLFGGEIRQIDIVKGTNYEDGTIDIPPLHIEGNSFKYVEDKEIEKDGGRMVVRTGVSFENGETVLGMMVPTAEIGNYELLYVQVPKYGSVEGAKYTKFNADAVEDVMQTMRYGQERETEEDVIRLENALLVKPVTFEVYSYSPDEYADLEKEAGMNFENALQVLGMFVKKPNHLIDGTLIGPNSLVQATMKSEGPKLL